MSLVAKLSYNEGKCVCLEIQVIIGFLPKAGMTLLAISENGLVGFIPSLGNRKLDELKTGVQLKIKDASSIAWSKTLERYVVVGKNGTILVSNEGLFWKDVENPSSKGLNKVLWNENLKHYLAIGKTGTLVISEDGMKWQICETKSEGSLNDILWCQLKRQYVLIGDAGYIALSSEGVHWQIQKNPVKSNLIGIAGTPEWDQQLNYVVITKQDEVIDSKDGKTWVRDLNTTASQKTSTKGMRAIFYDSSGYRRWFTIISGTPYSFYKAIYIWWRYHSKGYKGNPTAACKTVWDQKYYIYLSDYLQKATPNISEDRKIQWFEDLKLNVGVTANSLVLFNIRKIQWFEDLKLNVGVTANSLVLFNNGGSRIYKRVVVVSDALELFKKGFIDITLGNMPDKFKDDEKAVYYDLYQYS